MTEEPGYYDRQGNPISLEQWAKLSDDRSYRFLGIDRVSDRIVASIWLGLDVLFRSPAEGAELFQTTVFRPTDDTSRGIRFDGSEQRWTSDSTIPRRHYSTEADAQAGHAELIELVRQRSSR